MSRYDEDDEDRTRRITKKAKHSRNEPGKGMRIINSWYDESDDFDDDDDFNETVYITDSVSIVQTKQR